MPSPSTHSTATLIYNTFAAKLPVLLVLLIILTSGATEGDHNSDFQVLRLSTLGLQDN
jgi:hypothetical protein